MKNKNMVSLAPEIGRKLLGLLQICREVDPDNQQIQVLISAVIDHEITQDQVNEIAHLVKEVHIKLQSKVTQAQQHQEKALQNYEAQLGKTEHAVDQLETAMKNSPTV